MGYPILDLGRIRKDVVWYVRTLEEALIRTAGDFGIEAGRVVYSQKIDPKTGKRRNLSTFKPWAAAEKHERAVQYFKRR